MLRAKALREVTLESDGGLVWHSLLPGAPPWGRLSLHHTQSSVDNTKITKSARVSGQ